MSRHEHHRKLRYCYPFVGMTESDLLEIIFINLDPGKPEHILLNAINYAILNNAQGKAKELADIRDQCERDGPPYLGLVTNEDVDKCKNKWLVYSPQTLWEAIKRIHETELEAMEPRARREYIHNYVVEWDKERIESKSGHFHAIYKENYNNPAAKPREMISKAELKHNKEMERLANDIRNGRIGQVEGKMDEVDFSVFDLLLGYEES